MNVVGGGSHILYYHVFCKASKLTKTTYNSESLYKTKGNLTFLAIGKCGHIACICYCGDINSHS